MMNRMKNKIITTTVAAAAALCSVSAALAKPLDNTTVDPAPEQWFGTSLTIIVIFVICAVTVSVIRTKRGHAD